MRLAHIPGPFGFTAPHVIKTSFDAFCGFLIILHLVTFQGVHLFKPALSITIQF
jgi:hypothetical protein